MAQVNWMELIYRQLKRDPGRVSPDWWQRAGTIASIFSSIVIAAVGLLLTQQSQQLTRESQDAQKAISQAQLEATKVKNEEDRKGQAAKLASDLFPQIFSESALKRKVAIKVLAQLWRPPELEGILGDLTNDPSGEVRLTSIGLLDPSNSAAASTLAQISGDPSRPPDERALALTRLSRVARITTKITGASRSASFIWDGAPVPLRHRGAQYEAQFQSSEGNHAYALVLFGTPGDAWDVTITDGKATQDRSGHINPAGLGVTGDTVFSASVLGVYNATGGQFQRQAWCRDLLSVVNKSLAVPASIPGDAECVTAVPLVEAALERSPPADKKTESRDRLVVSQLKAAMPDLSGSAQARVCGALRGQAEVYRFCPDSGEIMKSVEDQERTYPDLYRKFVKGI